MPAATTPVNQTAIDFIAFTLDHARIFAGFLAERLDARADDASPDEYELAALAMIAADIRDRLERVTEDAIALTRDPANGGA